MVYDEREFADRCNNEQEADFQTSLASEKIRITRASIPLAATLFVFFGILDIFALPSSLYVAWAIRAAVLLWLMAVYALTWRPIFVRGYTIIVSGMYLAMGLSIEAIIALTQSTDFARPTYYAGIFLVVTGLYILTYLTSVAIAAVSFALFVIYANIPLQVHQIHTPAEWQNYISQLIFFLSVTTIGFIGMRCRERHLRENYLLKRALVQEIDAKEAARQKNLFLATHDALTTLPNRPHFENTLVRMIEQGRADNREVAVLFVDLDDFKPINDTLGHAAGDQVLRIVAHRIRAHVRDEDFVGRIGGDEFVVAIALPQNSVGVAESISAKVADSVAECIRVDDNNLYVKASIGLAIFPRDGDTADELLSVADKSMYAYKRGRAKNRV